MDELYEQALAHRARLLAELDAVEQLIRTYQKLRVANTRVRDDVQLPLWQPIASSRRQHAAAVDALTDAAKKIILEEGRPMTRGALVRRLSAAGHHIEGTDKNKVFGTNMWRSRKFLNLKGAGYWPKDAPLPGEYAHLEQRDTMLD